MQREEVSFQLPRSGLTLRGWRTPMRGGTPTLCLHGWMDNCVSFEPLADRMSCANLIAIDLPGHGWSDPLGSSTLHHLDFAACLLELIHVQSWPQVHLIGHSLGAWLGCLMAAIEPDRISRLVLIDGIGPPSTGPEQAVAAARRYLRAYLQGRRSRAYHSMGQANEVRAELAGISRETAAQLNERDLEPADDGYRWRSDERLRYPAVLTLSEEQVLAYLADIAAPTLLIVAEQTAMTKPYYAPRVDAVPGLRRLTVTGPHHVHIENPDPVADAIRSFLGDLV